MNIRDLFCVLNELHYRYTLLFFKHFILLPLFNFATIHYVRIHKDLPKFVVVGYRKLILQVLLIIVLQVFRHVMSFPLVNWNQAETISLFGTIIHLIFLIVYFNRNFRLYLVFFSLFLALAVVDIASIIS